MGGCTYYGCVELVALLLFCLSGYYNSTCEVISNRKGRFLIPSGGPGIPCCFTTQP